MEEHKPVGTRLAVTRCVHEGVQWEEIPVRSSRVPQPLGEVVVSVVETDDRGRYISHDGKKWRVDPSQ